MKTFKYLFTAMILFCCLLSEAAVPAHVIRQYGKAEGLSNLSVHSLAQDSNGFIWIGTSQGLDRFDGTHIRHYPVPREGGAEFQDNHRITSLCACDDGTLWVGTSCCLFLFDMQKETFHLVGNEKVQNIAAITQLMEDSEKHIWIVSATSLMRLDPQTNEVNSYPDFRSSAVMQSKNGIIWTTGFDGCLNKYDPYSDRFIKYQLLSEAEKEDHTFLVTLDECDDGSIVVASNKNGIKRFYPNTQECVQIIGGHEKEESITIHCMDFDKESRLWVGTEQGVRVYDLRAGDTPQLVHSFRKEYTQSHSLTDNAIHAILTDRENGCWVGTFFGGLNHIFKNRNTVRQFLPVGKTSRRVEANIIREIHADSKGRLWVGTEDGGIAMFNPADDSFRMVPLLQNGAKVVNIQGLCIERDTLWVGTYMNGLLKVDIDTWQIVDQYPYLNTTNVVCIRRTDDGKLLLGTFSGLFCLDEKAKSAYRIEGAEDCFIHAMHIDSQKQIWIGTFNNGLLKLERHEDRYTAHKTGFSRYGVGTIFEDSYHHLFIGTNGTGLYRYDEAENKTVHIRLTGKEQDALSICKILEDPFGRLWISTSDGLYCYDSQQGVVVHLTGDNGLPTSQFNFASGYSNGKDELFFGTYQGMVGIRPNDFIQEQMATPKVLITGVKTSDYESGFVKDTLTLDYHQASFSLDYSTSSAHPLGSLWYRYRMRGKDKAWTLCKGTHNIQFAGLSPGTYILEMEASFQNNAWKGEPTVLTIIITPPWWRHPLAYLAYAFSLISILIYIVLRYKRRMQRRHQHQIKELHAEKQQEILQAKISFFTAITHEIRTPLTLIMGCIDKLKGRNDKNVQVLEKNTRRLLDLVNQLLDFRKIESSRMLMNFSDIEIHPILRDVCDHFSPLSVKKGINVSIDIQEEDIHVIADKEAVIKMFSNMLGNAYKFCEHNVWISTATRISGNTEVLEIRVTNDGMRIPQDKEEEIFKPFVQYYCNNIQSPINGSGLGLPLIRSLAELTNGTFYLDREVKDLNSFVLQLPVQHTEPTATETTGEEKKSDAKADGKRNILIVDDETDIRRFVAEDLQDKYNVYEADNGKEALKILQQRNIQLVITDLMMPIMDGISLCKEIKGDIRLSHIPVIVLTAKVSLQDHIEVLNTKADAYIEKPFSTAHLQAQISNLIHSRELLRETFIHSPYAMVTDIHTNVVEDEFLQKLDRFINEHIYETLTVELLSEHMAMSTSTLYRKMKALTSLAPNDYIRLCRLKRAAKLLKEENVSIKEVSERMNFSSVSHFTNSFMKQFGVTPGAFKKS